MIQLKKCFFYTLTLIIYTYITICGVGGKQWRNSDFFCKCTSNWKKWRLTLHYADWYLEKWYERNYITIYYNYNDEGPVSSTLTIVLLHSLPFCFCQVVLTLADIFHEYIENHKETGKFALVIFQLKFNILTLIRNFDVLIKILLSIYRNSQHKTGNFSSNNKKFQY